MTAQRRAYSHVVARVEALDAAVKASGFPSRTQFADSLRKEDGAPSRATVLNLWAGNVVGIDFAEAIARALDVPVGDVFQLSNGRRIQ